MMEDISEQSRLPEEIPLEDREGLGDLEGVRTTDGLESDDYQTASENSDDLVSEPTVGLTEETDVGFFLNTLYLERDVVNPRFIKYLITKEHVRVIRSPDGTEHEISYYGEPFRTDDGVLIRPAMNFRTINGVIADPNELNQAVSDIRYHYDKFRNLELRRKMKRAGIATAIVLATSGLITGLALGLRRTGSDMVRNSKQQPKKVIPWVELQDLQDVTGKSFILVGDHIYLVIAGLAYLYYTSER